MLLKKWREILSPYSKAWAILGKLVQAFRQLQRTPRMNSGGDYRCVFNLDRQ